MNKTVSRVLWIVAGVLLIVAGGACMLHPGATLSGLSFLLGMAMLFSGVVDIMIFATAGSSIYGSGWFLVDGILTVLLSIFLLCNQMFTMMTLPYILGMWLLFSGITKFVNSFDLRRFGVRRSSPALHRRFTGKSTLPRNSSTASTTSPMTNTLTRP